MDEQTLWEIEKGFWLKGQEHYQLHIHKECIFCLPAPSSVMRGNGFVEHLPKEGVFDTVEFCDLHFALSSPQTACLAYKALGKMHGGGERQVLCSSTYLLGENGLQLIQHQQTECL